MTTGTQPTTILINLLHKLPPDCNIYPGVHQAVDMKGYTHWCLKVQWADPMVRTAFFSIVTMDYIADCDI